MVTDEQPVDKWDWVGAIETASGLHADLLNLQPEQIHIDDIATSLANICRFNGHLPSFYSVAEHSVRVSWWLRENGYDADMELTGLLHDAAEAYVGDLMRPLKRIPDMVRVFKPIEDNVMKVIHSTFGGAFPHPQAVHDADRAVYDWEAANIRTGKVVGLSPDMAKELFLDSLTGIYLSQELTEPPTACQYASIEDHLGNRRLLLTKAADLVDGDRNAQYGDPIDDFRRTATYWSTHIGGVYRRKMHVLGHTCDEDDLNIIDQLLDPHDVAIMMGQLKDSRLAWDPYKHDSWIDKAGYSACGYDCVIRES